MNYKIYKTPNLRNRLDTSLRYESNIANLLLTFDSSTNAKEGISRVVTCPAKNESGFNIVACQTFTRRNGHAAYVHIPETERLYIFREAVFPIRNAGKRFLKAGLKGLIMGAEEKGIVCSPVTSYEYDLFDASLQYVPNDDRYHFTGTAEKILEELQKKCTLILG
jgi:hypothetical protein